MKHILIYFIYNTTSTLIIQLNKIKNLPYCDLHFGNGKYVMKNSIEVKMIDLIAEEYNFQYEVAYANQSWGAIENGVWVGSVGHLHNKVLTTK